MILAESGVDILNGANMLGFISILQDLHTVLRPKPQQITNYNQYTFSETQDSFYTCF
jgi:hypothetical protein